MASQEYLDSMEDDADDIDRLVTVARGSASRPSAIASNSDSAQSSDDEIPVESPRQTAESLIPTKSRSKGGTPRRLMMKHRKIVSAPYSTKSRSRCAEGADQSILAELRKTNKQLGTLTAKFKKSNQKIHKLEKTLQDRSSSSSCSSSPTSECKKSSTTVPSGIRVRSHYS